MKKFWKTALLFMVWTAANSAVLFEVKDNAGKIIMEVSDDGARFFNPQYTPVGTEKDTLMIISATNIKALVRKAGGGSASRDFDIADIGSIRKGTGKSVMKMSVKDGYGIGGDSAIVYYKPKNAFRAQSIIQNTNLVGQTSFASGYLCEASGQFSTAMGKETKATDTHSTAFGYYTEASGYNSIAMGANTISSSAYSTSMGNASTASGMFSTAMGNGTKASGFVSTAMGLNTNAIGENSTAMGYYSTSQARTSLAIGRYNKLEGSSDTWNDTDPLFVIGNGTDINHLSNAFEVKKNGDTYINGNSYVSGAAYIPALNATTGSGKYVLVDSSGKLCVSDLLPPKEQSGALEKLQKENSDLKAQILALDKTTSEQEERIVKLEAMLNLLLKNNK